MKKESLIELKRKLLRLGAAVSLASVMSTTTVQAKPAYGKTEIDLVHDIGIPNATGILNSLREKGIITSDTISSCIPVKYLEEVTSIDYHNHMKKIDNKEVVDYDWLYNLKNIEEVSFTNTNLEEINKVLSILKPNRINSINISQLSNKEVNEILKEFQDKEIISLTLEPKVITNKTLDDCKIDFSLINNIKELNILGNLYELPIVFTNKDIDLLRQKKININYDINGGNTKDLEKIEKDLDDYYKELDIKDTDDVMTKMKKIIIFVVNKYEYSKKIKEMTDEECDNYDHSEFYQYGYLRGNYNEEQICGNYAALVNALAIRSGLESWIVSGHRHVYNIVKNNKDYNIYDATWSDNLSTRKSDYKKLDWFCRPVNQDINKDPLDSHYIDSDLYASIESKTIEAYGITEEEYKRGIK